MSRIGSKNITYLKPNQEHSEYKHLILVKTNMILFKKIKINMKCLQIYKRRKKKMPFYKNIVTTHQIYYFSG